MVRNAILMTCLVLIVGGCATEGNGNKVEPSGISSSTASSPPASSNPAMVGVAAAESSSTSPTVSGTAATESNSMKQPNSRQSRIAAGVEEETLDTCLARIPEDATAGQRMLAEQTCRRDFAGRR